MLWQHLNKENRPTLLEQDRAVALAEKSVKSGYNKD